ncbi:uncharacterized protein Fot_11894 [Forsythia ovata]|uniref:Uncharacterized protein n=1 Tax=Forsythia ovata TaxID=205694 RepID=A0ABD1WKZ7_9LAMI
MELGADAEAEAVEDNDKDTTAVEEGAGRLVITLNDFRQYSVDTDKEVDKINLKFVEARYDIKAAMESKETVYFDEEAECTRACVNEVLEMYEGLFKMLLDNQMSAIQRAIGLKIEQVKAELAQLNED